jgi:hypothetical protein
MRQLRSTRFYNLGVLAAHHSGVLYSSNALRLGVRRCREGLILHFLEWLADRVEYAAFAIRFAILDLLLGPEPQTAADKLRKRRRERLRKAFPTLDLDGRKRRG